MTRSELVSRLSEQLPNLPVKDVESAVKTMLDVMAAALADTKRIEVRGFGSFALNFRAERAARNPKSGATVQVKAKLVPHFKPGKELRCKVDQSRESGIAVQQDGHDDEL